MSVEKVRIVFRTVYDSSGKVTFTGDEIKSIQLTQGVDLVSSSLVSNVCDIEFQPSSAHSTFEFTRGLQFDIYYFGQFLQTMFIEESERVNEYVYSVTGHDWIGRMDEIMFYGANGAFDRTSSNTMYNLIIQELGEGFGNVASSISSAAKAAAKAVPIVVTYAPTETLRDAMAQLFQACGVVANTAYVSDGIDIYTLAERATRVLEQDRIRQYPSYSQDDEISLIKITWYEQPFIVSAEAAEETLFDPRNYLDADGNMIYCEEGDAVILDHYEKIISYNSNYYTRSAGWGGKRMLNSSTFTFTQDYNSSYYDKFLIKTQPIKIFEKYMSETLSTTTTVDNPYECDGNRFISGHNASAVMTNLKRYATLNKTATVKVNCGYDGQVLVKYGAAKYGAKKYGEMYSAADDYSQIKPGDTVKIDTNSYMGTITGIVKQITFNLNGTLMFKELEIAY